MVTAAAKTPVADDADARISYPTKPPVPSRRRATRHRPRSRARSPCSGDSPNEEASSRRSRKHPKGADADSCVGKGASSDAVVVSALASAVSPLGEHNRIEKPVPKPQKRRQKSNASASRRTQSSARRKGKNNSRKSRKQRNSKGRKQRRNAGKVSGAEITNRKSNAPTAVKKAEKSSSASVRSEKSTLEDDSAKGDCGDADDVDEDAAASPPTSLSVALSPQLAVAASLPSLASPLSTTAALSDALNDLNVSVTFPSASKSTFDFQRSDRREAFSSRPSHTPKKRSFSDASSSSAFVCQQLSSGRRPSFPRDEVRLLEQNTASGSNCICPAHTSQTSSPSTTNHGLSSLSVAAVTSLSHPLESSSSALSSLSNCLQLSPSSLMSHHSSGSSSVGASSCSSSSSSSSSTGFALLPPSALSSPSSSPSRSLFASHFGELQSSGSSRSLSVMAPTTVTSRPSFEGTLSSLVGISSSAWSSSLSSSSSSTSSLSLPSLPLHSQAHHKLVSSPSPSSPFSSSSSPSFSSPSSSSSTSSNDIAEALRWAEENRALARALAGGAGRSSAFALGLVSPPMPSSSIAEPLQMDSLLSPLGEAEHTPDEPKGSRGTSPAREVENKATSVASSAPALRGTASSESTASIEATSTASALNAPATTSAESASTSSTCKESTSTVSVPTAAAATVPTVSESTAVSSHVDMCDNAPSAADDMMSVAQPLGEGPCAMDICDEDVEVSGPTGTNSSLSSNLSSVTGFSTVHASSALHSSLLASGVPQHQHSAFPTAADVFLASLPRPPKYPCHTADVMPLHWDICTPTASTGVGVAGVGVGSYVSHRYTPLFASGGRMAHGSVPVPEEMIGAHFSHAGASLSFARAEVI